MLFKALFFLMSCFSLSLNANENRNFFILKDRPGAGMFSMFTDVLALMHSYERNVFCGVEVNFGKKGLYYDPELGPNWWNYYCEPINFGEKMNIYRGFFRTHASLSPLFFFKDREEAYHLIEKYIHVKSNILEKVEQFRETHFKNHFIIGIHYRGTDAPKSSPAYDSCLKEIQKTIDLLSLENSDFKIFIATDEQPFVDYMVEMFGEHICFQENFRSTKGGPPLHINGTYNHYKQGEEALTDCLLLSKCSLMMLTYSNLSMWAALFNPFIPMIDLSKKLPIIK